MALSLKDFTYATFLSVDYGNSSGSGFRLKKDDLEYLITAKHVVYQNIFDKYGKKIGEEPREDILVVSKNYDSHESYAYSASIDLKQSKIQIFEDKDIAIVTLDENKNYEVREKGIDINPLSIEDFDKLENVLIASNIYIVGFPSSLVDPRDFEVDRPLLRSGIIAGINYKKQTFIIDSPAFYGNSGGAVVQKTEEGLKVIGIVSRYIPFVTDWYNIREKEYSRQEFYNSGYAICEPLDEIINYLHQ